MEGQTIQNSEGRRDTIELINGQEVREKETVNHGVESKTFPLCALVVVGMFYTQLRINQTWGEVLNITQQMH